MILTFTIPGPPVGKARPRVVRGQAYTPQKTKEYEKHVALCAMGALSQAGRLGCQPADIFKLPVYLDLRIYHGDARRRDADNVVKAIMDGLVGVLWKDDADVWPRVQWVARGSLEPRVEVGIMEALYRGMRMAIDRRRYEDDRD